MIKAKIDKASDWRFKETKEFQDAQDFLNWVEINGPIILAVDKGVLDITIYEPSYDDYVE